MKPLVLYLFPLALVLLSCNQDKSKQQDQYTKTDRQVSANTAYALKGKTLMENKCYLCHSPKAKQDSRIGPPMIAIKQRYLKNAKSKDEFIAAVWDFVKQPSAEKAKLKGAVKQFGVMPYQAYDQKEIEAIAAFMYDYKIEEPEWFQEHKNKKHKQKRKRQRGKSTKTLPQQEQSYADIGMSYAKSTKSTLGKNLMGAIQKEGVLHALSFCNVQAMPLTDSMATKHQATIRRVSDKNRNPLNKANTKELEYIKHFKGELSNGKQAQPIVVEENQKVNFYYPIVTNDMCLKCHGSPEKDIAPKTLKQIKLLYPNDKAIGYNVNEVRGIWSISFDKNE